MKKIRGFALLTPEQHLEISRAGGQRAHQIGRAHKWTSEEARIASLKGVAKRRAMQQEQAR